MYLWTPLCRFVAILSFFSQCLSFVIMCGGLLLNVVFSFSSTRCVRLPGFALIRLSYRCVISVICCFTVYIYVVKGQFELMYVFIIIARAQNAIAIFFSLVIIYRDCFPPPGWGSHAYGILTIFTELTIEMMNSVGPVIAS